MDSNVRNAAARIDSALILERSDGCSTEEDIYTLSFHNLGLSSMLGAPPVRPRRRFAPPALS